MSNDIDEKEYLELRGWHRHGENRWCRCPPPPHSLVLGPPRYYVVLTLEEAVESQLDIDADWLAFVFKRRPLPASSELPRPPH